MPELEQQVPELEQQVLALAPVPVLERLALVQELELVVELALLLVRLAPVQELGPAMGRRRRQQYSVKLEQLHRRLPYRQELHEQC